MIIGILNSGGDCPGINAVIEGFVTSAYRRGWRVIGFHDGFEGLLPVAGGRRYEILTPIKTHKIRSVGGTILGTTNTGNFNVRTNKVGRASIDKDVMAKAKKTITDMGLVVGQVQPSPSDEQEAGKVWYQSVAVNASVTEGTTVDIFVSTGPSGGSGSGDTVTKTFTLTLPTNLGEDLHVEVVDSQEQTVFSGDYNINLDTAAEIPVSGSGVQTYTIYINGHSYTQQTVDFGA